MGRTVEAARWARKIPIFGPLADAKFVEKEEKPLLMRYSEQVRNLAYWKVSDAMDTHGVCQYCDRAVEFERDDYLESWKCPYCGGLNTLPTEEEKARKADELVEDLLGDYYNKGSWAK